MAEYILIYWRDEETLYWRDETPMVIVRPDVAVCWPWRWILKCGKKLRLIRFEVSELTFAPPSPPMGILLTPDG